MSTTAKKKAPAKKTAAKKAASRSGNPAKRAEAAKVSDISAFKQRAQGVTLPLPSGLAVKAKRVELKTFIKQGNVPNPLMGIVNEALEKGQAADVEKIVGGGDGEVDLDMIREMYEMVDSVVVASIVEPKVHPDPEEDEEADDDLLYVADIDDEDKMFIWQWALGGTSDVETFRLEARADMDAVAQIQSNRGKAK